MNRIRRVAFRLWVVASAAIVIAAAASALSDRDLSARVPDAVREIPERAVFQASDRDAFAQYSKQSCIPGTVVAQLSSPDEFEKLVPGYENADIVTQFDCASWERLGWRGALAISICAFAGLIGAGLLWVGAGLREGKNA